MGCEKRPGPDQRVCGKGTEWVSEWKIWIARLVNESNGQQGSRGMVNIIREE
jgi:hypothetical protein